MRTAASPVCSTTLIALTTLICLVCPMLASAQQPARPPHILFIMADDLGYAELGCFGQTKIRTPNIDSLATAGLRFTAHYSGSPVCAPSRCVLMTGRHSGHAYIRDNGDAPGERGQLAIPGDTITIAKLLKELGYTTGGFGKWGLGGPGSVGDPLKQGFDHFFGYLDQRHAHNFYPDTIFDDGQEIPLNNPKFAPYAKLNEGEDPNSAESYRRFTGTDYVPDLAAAKALAFIRENRDRPFFLYYPTTIPHLALQVPEDSLKEYVGRWDDPPYVGDKSYLPHQHPRAAYAAMVTRLDRHVGQLLALLKELNLEQNTIVVFTSDNGPTYDRLGGSDSDFFQSAGGFKGLKGSMYEGGIRVPMIIRYPGRIAAGSTSARVTAFEDWMPTLLELAGGSKLIPADCDGISFAPTLFGKDQPARPFLYREFASYGGQQAVWIGQYKGIRQKLLPPRNNRSARPNYHIELYDLAADPGETMDISADHPELVARIATIMRQQHVASRQFPFPALDTDQTDGVRQ